MGGLFNHFMRVVSTLLGLLMICFGGIWILQGLNIIKKNHAIKFLQEGCKVKAYVFFKGREIVFKVQGEILLLKFANELEEYGKAEQLPVLEGKKMIMLIGPKKK